MNNTMNLELALAEYGTSVATSYSLNYINAKGEKVEKTLNKPENVRLMVALDESQRLGKRLDLARCLMFATIERTINKDKALGLSTRDFIMQKWHYSKATTNQYLAIGMKFYTNTGNEKVKGISNFTVGQIIPFLAFVNDFPTIGGLDTDYAFLEWFITNGYISADMTSTEIEGIAKLMKDGYIPKEWVKESADSKLPYFVKCADIDGEIDMQFPLMPYIEVIEVANSSAETETDKTETENDKTETETETPKLSVTVRRFLATLSDMPMTDDLRDELSALSESVIKWAVKVEKSTETETEKTETETETETEKTETETEGKGKGKNKK